MVRRIGKVSVLLLGLIACLLTIQGLTVPADSFKTGFLNPPDSAEICVYLYFMDENTSREAMTADLEPIKAAGTGNVLILEAKVKIPRGELDLLSGKLQALNVYGCAKLNNLGSGSSPGPPGCSLEHIDQASALHLQHIYFT